MKGFICYIGRSIHATEEPHALTVGFTDDPEYRSYIKQMTIVWSTPMPTKGAARKAEKRALKWIRENYDRALVKYGRWAFPDQSPTRTNDWYFIENDKPVFMREVIELLREDNND
jgi:hypothetical protein